MVTAFTVFSSQLWIKARFLKKCQKRLCCCPLWICLLNLHSIKMWDKNAAQSYMKRETYSRRLWWRHCNVERFSVLTTLISNDESAFCVKRGRFSWRTAPEVSNVESVRPLGHKNGSYCFSCSPLHLNRVCELCRKSQLNHSLMRTWSDLYVESGLSVRFRLDQQLQYNHHVFSLQRHVNRDPHGHTE